MGSLSLYQHVPAAFRELVGRADAVDEIAAYVTDGAHTPASDRIDNPIIASVGSMAAGKTELLLSLPAALAVHTTSKAWMQNAVPIFITFNGETPREMDSEIDVEDAAARRILFAHFAEALGYREFNRALDCQPLDVWAALECVLEFKELRGIEHPSVLLFFDELMKCGWPPAESHPEAGCQPDLRAGGSAFEALQGLHTAVEILKRAVLVNGEASPPVRLDELFQHTMEPKTLPEWWENTEVRFKVPRWCTTEEREHLHFDFDNVVVAGRDKIPEPRGGGVIVPDSRNNPATIRAAM